MQTEISATSLSHRFVCGNPIGCKATHPFSASYEGDVFRYETEDGAAFNQGPGYD